MSPGPPSKVIPLPTWRADGDLASLLFGVGTALFLLAVLLSSKSQQLQRRVESSASGQSST